MESFDQAVAFRVVSCFLVELDAKMGCQFLPEVGGKICPSVCDNRFWEAMLAYPLRESPAAGISCWGSEWVAGWPSRCSIDDCHDVFISSRVR